MPVISTRTVPFGAWETWVRITEPDEPQAGALPLVVLHGGPGMAHDYLRNLDELARTGRTVIHYDQLGCGNSTHLPGAAADFWTPQLFVDEFENLVAALGLADYHLLGQSWGGVLGAEIATRRPGGLRSLSICNSPASMGLWSEGAAGLRALLPEDVQSTLTWHEAAGTITHPDYLAASEVFYERHVCRVVPVPDDFRRSVAQMEADPTVYHTMNGANEFHVVGTLRTWSIIDRLGRIEAPTLVVAGEFDEATPATWQPYLEHIPDATSHVFAGASHCAHLEQPETFRSVIAAFLAWHDS
ncbi:MAG: proline iminopeptidase-family hydrolase [Ramlibacter sp.]|nr:proline iminopeptidase-family hydrolase [Cryobacterium sp.]